jgi:hypothetical protein
MRGGSDGPSWRKDANTFNGDNLEGREKGVNMQQKLLEASGKEDENREGRNADNRDAQKKTASAGGEEVSRKAVGGNDDEGGELLGNEREVEEPREEVGREACMGGEEVKGRGKVAVDQSIVITSQKKKGTFQRVQRNQEEGRSESFGKERKREAMEMEIDGEDVVVKTKV